MAQPAPSSLRAQVASCACSRSRGVLCCRTRPQSTSTDHPALVRCMCVQVSVWQIGWGLGRAGEWWQYRGLGEGEAKFRKVAWRQRELATAQRLLSALNAGGFS